MKLLINAKIFPNNRSRSIIIKNNKIEFIGNQDDINISSKSLDIIDCKNNSVLPGLIDAHIHLFESISNLE
ncbi:MAG: amidohydrolase, partial [SAR202 cluster bacterium]|nr:amidohydrolase [SAR202 cluster bacterium]